jgi:hypothetical protein
MVPFAVIETVVCQWRCRHSGCPWMLCPGVSVFDKSIVQDPEISWPMVIAREMSAAPLSGFYSK